TTLPMKVDLTNKEGMDIKNLKVELHSLHIFKLRFNYLKQKILFYLSRYLPSQMYKRKMRKYHSMCGLQLMQMILLILVNLIFMQKLNLPLIVNSQYNEKV
ncbi:hypothetical protein ABE137_21320, partial [Brevibacillus laterosporus]|uniref:hypothetical protein n=1 Tax=Brevibacillus laterosporus TaxID=1465 RepID=UPI003D23098A